MNDYRDISWLNLDQFYEIKYIINTVSVMQIC